MPFENRGMTLIDVLVGTSVAVIIFLGIFVILQASASITGASASKATALALANGRIEMLRSLPYASIGTVGGIPSGAIAQEETIYSDLVPYEVRTFISYYDDAKDGSGAADSNGIQADYKRAKVTVTYETQNGEREVAVVSTFAPIGIETTAGGGTLRVVVVDADGVAVPGAEVVVENPNTTPTIDVTTYTDFAGYALFPGAATSTGYEVSVTKGGWSTARTYSQDATNQNPTPGHLTIAGGQTTTGTFAIDELAAVLVRSFTPVVPGTWSDAFIDASNLVTMVGVSVGGGELTLATGADGYEASGAAVASSVAPTYLVAWHEASFTPATPGGTTLLVKVTDAAGTLVPDAALPGNSSGFAASPIDLSALATSTYPSLSLRAELSTAATTTTPTLADWGLAYSRGPIPYPSLAFSLTGAKAIGSTVGGAPIYKTELDETTDSSGSIGLDLEWDSYTLSLSGPVIIDTCAAFPLEVAPGAGMTADIIVATSTGNALKAYAKFLSGSAVASPTFTLSRSGFSRTLPGNVCGFAYFGDLTPAADYALSVTSTSTTESFTDISISGLSSYDAILD
ncbi:MAG: hypothetical protein KBC38_03580 [Candidatus Pacebacteria bacterium]|nr:hypothetical protein [Candidatus Paceibacterota bacterium]MBP9840137.1 hypothetical protein [Candidatus Paceibacterota bacterium]